MSESQNRSFKLEQQNRLAKSSNPELNIMLQEEKELLQRNHESSQKSFKSVFNQSPFGNKIISEDFTIIRVNKKLLEILGYRKSELIGKKVLEFTHPDFIQRWEKLRKELWSTSNVRESFSIDSCLIRKDKSVVWCHVTSILFHDDGKRLGYTIVEDITDRIETQRIKDELVQHQHLLELKNQEHLRQKELFDATIRTQEEERERLATQLHHSLGQRLYAAKIKLSLLNRRGVDESDKINALTEASVLLSASLTECSRTAHDLSPRIFDIGGLKEAANNLSLQHRNAINFKFQLERSFPIKDKYVEIFVFRTVQELLLNIIKHGKASEASCKVKFSKKSISIRMEDNWEGPEAEDWRKKGLDLSTLKNHVEMLEGKFAISSERGGGAVITITFPRIKFD